jgi:hypothetical protein
VAGGNACWDDLVIDLSIVRLEGQARAIAGGDWQLASGKGQGWEQMGMTGVELMPTARLLACLRACWLACWLAGLLARWLACWLAGWPAGLLACLAAGDW